MSLAVRFDRYGDVDVLRVEDVARPVPGPGRVLVRVEAAGINPGELVILSGALHERWPAAFPSGQGSDLAGTVEEVGEGVTRWAAGDEVIGFTNERASHAQYVTVPAEQLVRRPAGVDREVGGALFVAGSTACASVQAVAPAPGETVVVSGAAGGVGSLTVQLAKRTGATVIGLAGEANHEWLAQHGVVPVAYGEGVRERIQAASNGSVDAFLDTYGDDYIRLAVDLGVAPDRINTIINYPDAQKYGTKTAGNADGATPEILSELVQLLDKGALDLPVARTYPLTQVHEAFRELKKRHTRGKIVLLPWA